MKSAASKVVSSLGQRLTAIRGERSQPSRALELGVHKNTYARWERGEADISAEGLAALSLEGWNANWLLTGEGPERLKALQTSDLNEPGEGSQPLRPEDLRIAIELAEEALDGGRLEADDYAELVSLIYDLLVNGLPDAQVLPFAQFAARKARGGKAEDVGQGAADQKPSGGGKKAAR